MPNKKNTIHDRFPVHDITHYPRRRQADNVTQEEENPISARVSQGGMNHVTLEKAISFYESNTKDPTFGTLYLRTAEWLRVLLDQSKPTTTSVQEGE